MPNCLEGVDPTVLTVMSKLEGALSGDLPARVQICLSEALYNLVIHAKGADASVPIDVGLTIDDDTVRLEIFDPAGAAPFDLRLHARELAQVDLMAERGRGLSLIMECADSVDYGTSNGRNRLSLGFDRREEGSASEPVN